MTTLTLLNLRLSIQFGISFQVVQSWCKRWFFSDLQTWQQFFHKNINIIKAKPFIKWVWWKRQLITQFEKLYPKEFNNYFEPFLWWWAVFFNLQRDQSFLSDVNEELINVYQIIKTKPKKLISFLESLEYSKEKFLELRLWDRQEWWLKKYSAVERAGRFIYLNRTCFNGLYRVNSKWEFNVPFWTYSNPDYIQKENILNSSKLLNETRSVIKLQSFEKVLDNAKKWDFVYFDPPYDVISNSSNFTSYDRSWFGQDMQKKLADVFKKLSKKGVNVMLSNHNTTFIKELYKWFRFEIVKAKRNINSKGSGRGEVEEVVVMNY
jgi:DNA adenine methylase